jgi:hypothetical protein
MRPSKALLLAWFVLGGCYPPPPRYLVQRSARVPRPTVPLRTGQPLSGPIELSAGMSSIGHSKRPEASDPMTALEIPNATGRGELRLRFFDNGEVAAIHERALGGATKLDDTQADVTSGNPWGAGAAVRYSINNGARWSVGLDFEFMRWVLPYTELRRCVENCEGVDTVQNIHSTSTHSTGGLGVTPAYRFGRVTLFGGVYMRNHPTIDRKGEELTEYNDGDTTNGPANVLVHAGIAFRHDWFEALVLVNQNMEREPVFYGPSIGFALSATLDPARWAGGEPGKIEQARTRMRRSQARRE